MDVTDHRAVATAVNRVVERAPLKVVVWAAGVFDWHRGGAASADVADPAGWRRVLDVNLTAAAVLRPLVLAAAPSATSLDVRDRG